jgi:uncharacterized membrane protein YkvA (DUF1232 family)
MPLRFFTDWYRKTIRNPKYRLWIVLGTLAYLFSPLDISPDMFPILGQIDDVVVVSLLVTELSQMLMDWRRRPDDVAEADPEQSAGPTVDVNATSVD